MIILLENYLKNGQQRVALNGLSFSWKKILAEIPQRSLLGPFLFLIYVNDLPHDISSICKMFADDTSLFSKVKNSSLSLSDLNFNLGTINHWANNHWDHQWKMSFNLEPNKQAKEVLFSPKLNSDDHPKLTFNANQVQRCSSQKHFGLFLDNDPDFNNILARKLISVTK